MIWTDNNNETNKFEAVRRPELSIPMQELVAGLNGIRIARANVEVSISGVVARLATQEYNENLERARKAAQSQAIRESHEYPLVSNAAAAPAPVAVPQQPTVHQQPETDILHEDELDPDAIREMLNDIRDSLEKDK